MISRSFRWAVTALAWLGTVSQPWSSEPVVAGEIGQAAASLPGANASLVDGAARFVRVAAAPIGAAPDGAAFGALYLSVPVRVIGAQSGALHVRTRLWMHGDPAALGPLYTAPLGAVAGRLDSLPALRVISGSAAKGWSLIEFDSYLATDAVAEDLDAVWMSAEFDYHLTCADCHTLHAPEEYSSMQWGMIMARMAKFAKLDADDAMVILKWLQNTSDKSPNRKRTHPL